MRKLLFVSAIALLSACKDDPEPAFYTIRYQAEALRYPALVIYGNGNNAQLSDSIRKPFDTTFYNQKGGEWAGVTLNGRDNDTANVLKVRLTIDGKEYKDEYPSNAAPFPISTLSVELPEFKED